MSLIDNILTELERIRDERGTHANTATRVGTALIDLLSLIRDIGNSKLSKTDDDTASGEIGFQKGLWVKTANGASKVIELLTSGLAKVKSLLVNGTWGIDDDGDATLHDVAANDVTARDAAIRDVTGRDAEFENLRVTKEAHFFRLVVNELLSNKGAIIISSANCVAEIVVADPDHETPYYYDVYFPTTDRDGNSVSNPWVAGDQAVCLTFKGEGSGTFNNVKNRYYWRFVNLASSNVTYNGGTYHLVRLSNVSGDFDGSTVPAAGDNIVQLGYQDNDNDARQTAIIISSYQTMDTGVTPPSLAFYKGINDFSLSSHRYTYMDGVANEFFGDFKVLVNNSYTSITTLLATTNRLIAEIRNDLGTVGVDINGDDMTINLKAGKVNFLMPDDSTNAKISIDPTTGTLHAVDGVFEGTVKANNLYHGVCFLSAVGGFLNHRWYCKPSGVYNDSWPAKKAEEDWDFNFETGKYYTTEEILQISDNVIQSPAQSGFERCSGYSDIVYVLPAVNNTYPEVWLPHPADVEGKVVDVYGFYYGTPSTIPSFDVRCVFKNSQQEKRMALLLEYNTGAPPKLIVSSPSSYLPVTAGQLTRFVSVRAVVNNEEGCYWLKINLSEGSGGSGVTETRVIELIQSNAATRQWVDDQHFLTSFTESDPTVPSWAKQSSKPSYSFSEIGGSVAASQLPTLYWANVQVSNQSNNNTSPQFGELRLRPGSNNYGSHLYFGDGSHCYLYENSYDHLKIHADNGIELSVGSNYSVTYGGYEIATQTWVQQQGYLSSSAISDMATMTWVGQNCLAKNALTGRVDDDIVFGTAGKGLVFYAGSSTYQGKLYIDNSRLAFTDSNGNTKKVLLQGDADKNIPLYDSNGNWSGGVTSLNGLTGYFRHVNAGVYKLDYLPNGDVGVNNGDVLRTVDFPGYEVMQADSRYNQDYTGPDDYSIYAYLRAIIRWAYDNYRGINKMTLIGCGRPSVLATIILCVYPDTGIDPTTKLPIYSFGIMIPLASDGDIIRFGTINYAWYGQSLIGELHEKAAQTWVQNNYLPLSGNAASATKALKVVQGNNDRLVTNANGVTVVGGNNNSTIGFKTDGSAHYEPYIMTRKTLDSNNNAEFHLDYYTANGGHHFKDATSGYADVYAKSFVANGSSNDYVLLGGGGTKAVTDFATWMDRPVTARGLNVAGDSTLAAPHVRVTYDYVSGGRFSMNFKGYAADTMVAPISYIFDAPVTQSSDIRMKDVTDYLEPSVYDMASAPLVRFRWKNEAAGAEHVGTVAQYWQRVVPELVGETQEGWLTMDYQTAGVVAGVTAARKAVELERRIEEQDRRIEELEQIINQLKGN